MRAEVVRLLVSRASRHYRPPPSVPPFDPPTDPRTPPPPPGVSGPGQVVSSRPSPRSGGAQGTKVRPRGPRPPTLSGTGRRGGRVERRASSTGCDHPGQARRREVAKDPAFPCAVAFFGRTRGIRSASPTGARPTGAPPSGTPPGSDRAGRIRETSRRGARGELRKPGRKRHARDRSPVPDRHPSARTTRRSAPPTDLVRAPPPASGPPGSTAERGAPGSQLFPAVSQV